MTKVLRTLGLACAVAVTGAAAREPETAGWRHRRTAREIGERGRHPEKRWNSDIGRLDDRAFRARAAEVAREVAADLTDPSLRLDEKRPALEALKEIGPLAAGVSDTLVAALGAHDDDGTSRESRSGYFCEVTRVMAKVAPRDPAVIRALAEALPREHRKTGRCHTCTCALEVLKGAGLPAAPIAVPVLERLAPTYRSYLADFENAIESMGAVSTLLPALVARAANEQGGIDERAATLRLLGRSYRDLAPDQQAAVRATAETLVNHKHDPIRMAAAELLGQAGPSSLAALVHGLDDPRYDVRAAAARSLAGLGPAAAPARHRLIAALDPFLGTGEAAAEALVAIGPSVLADVEDRARSVPRHLRGLLEATARAVPAGSMAPVREALARLRAPGGSGYVDIEVVGGGEGQAYGPRGHRIKARFRGGAYAPSGHAPATVDDTLSVDDPPNAFFGALVGRRAGDRLRLLLSPETRPDPYSATPRSLRSPLRDTFLGTGAVFDVEVLRVCEPVIWTLFRGGGIVGPMQFELYCR